MINKMIIKRGDDQVAQVNFRRIYSGGWSKMRNLLNMLIILVSGGTSRGLAKVLRDGGEPYQ